jgi:branched-chain amino acid transport system substrate-binding protein
MIETCSRRAVGVLVGVLLVCLGTQSAIAAEPVRLGASLPLSGSATAWGQQARAALRLAEHDINAAGPINGSRMEIVVKDDGGESSQAVLLTRQMISTDRVAAILGPHLSGQAQVVVPLAKLQSVPFIETAAAVPHLIDNARPWAVRIALVGEVANTEPLKLWLQAHKVKRIAIGYENSNPATRDAGSRQFVNGARAAGVEVVNADSPVVWNLGMSDFSAVVTKLRSYGDIDALALANSNEAPLMAREMQRQGVTLPVWTGNIWGDDQSLITRAGDSVENWASVSQNWSGDPAPQVKDFVARFQSQLKQDTGKDETPNTYAYNYYYAALVTAQILRNGKLDGSASLDDLRKVISAGWNSLKDYPVLQGAITIGKDGEAKRKLFVLEVKGGKWQVQQTYDPK